MINQHYTADEARVRQLNEIMQSQIRSQGAESKFPGGKMTFDATGTLFGARELEYIEAEIYRTEYADYKAREIFPMNYEGSDYTDYITYRVMDYQGKARLLNTHSAGDIPIVSTSYKEVRNPVVRFADAYEYSVIDLAKAAHTNLPLDRENAFAARDVLEREIDKTAWFGNDEVGLTGFLNNPAIPVGNVPNGAGGFPEWTTKTQDEIIKDFILGFSEVRENSNGKEYADTVIIPIAQYNLLTQPRSGLSDTSILQWLIRNLPDLGGRADSIKWAPVLKGAGTAGSDIMIFYRKDQRKLNMSLPVDIKIEAPQLKDLVWKTIMRSATAGVIVRYPLSINIKEKI